MKYAIAAAAAAAFAATAAHAGGEGKMSAAAEAMNAKVEAHFKEVDADADGKVTEAELVNYMTAKAKSEFAEASGGDGVMTLDEAKAHHKSKHEAMMKEHKAMDHGEHKSGDH
jgi:Ca2+-binding EF-hand superfamily protein